jgi:hypothetical protein
VAGRQAGRSGRGAACRDVDSGDTRLGSSPAGQAESTSRLSHDEKSTKKRAKYGLLGQPA